MNPQICEKGDGVQNIPIFEFCEKLHVLKKSDAISRRNTLKDVRTTLFASELKLLHCSKLNEKFQELTFLFINTLTDDSEKCREISAELLDFMFRNVGMFEAALPKLLQILVPRLTKTDEREPSEEVRLIELQLLYVAIEKYDGDLVRHLDDIASILSSCLVDEFPEIKKKSCLCLTLLASKENSNFQMIGSTFLKSLIPTMTHQHSKTRALCVDALVAVVDYLNHEEFKEAISCLTQRLFDRSPLVRKAVTKGVGKMLISLKDRYSYFHYLIPLAISSLSDEIEEISILAQDVWEAAGKKYFEENEADYKDILTASRGRLGCRILVQRNMYNILPALLNDLSDWSVEARLMASKVLSSLIQHSEEKITISLSSVLEGILLAAKDDEKLVANEALKSAELLGRFVEPNLLIDSILKTIHENPTAGKLSVLASILRGHKGVLPTECFLALCKFLAHPSVSRLRLADEQAHLLSSVECLLVTGNEITGNASYELFTIISSISGLTVHEAISKKAEDLMDRLAELQSSSVMFLFKQHSVPLMKVLCENNELWTLQSPEVHIFGFVVESGCFDEELIEIAIPVLINGLHPSKDAKFRSQVLTLLKLFFSKLSSSDYEMFSEKIIELIRLGLFPNITWSAGKTASSLRTIATASLYEIVNNTYLKKEMLDSIGNELLPILETLLDDDAEMTRLLSGKILEIILPYLQSSVDELRIHKTCQDILCCMDDESDEIRLMTLRVLKAYIKSFPKEYDWRLYRAYLKNMFESVLIHMDDKDEKIRTSVKEFLNEVGFVAPDVLLQEIESKKYMMMSSYNLSKELTDSLINIKL